MNPGAILLFILVVIVLQAIGGRKRHRRTLPPVSPAWPRVPQAPRAPEPARPAVPHPAERQSSAHLPAPSLPAPPVPVRPSLQDRSPHQITERELTTAGAGGLDAPPGSALARLQASIEARRVALEKRHAKGVSIRSADRGSS